MSSHLPGAPEGDLGEPTVKAADPKGMKLHVDRPRRTRTGAKTGPRILAVAGLTIIAGLIYFIFVSPPGSDRSATAVAVATVSPQQVASAGPDAMDAADADAVNERLAGQETSLRSGARRVVSTTDVNGSDAVSRANAMAAAMPNGGSHDADGVVAADGSNLGPAGQTRGPSGMDVAYQDGYPASGGGGSAYTARTVDTSVASSPSLSFATVTHPETPAQRQRAAYLEATESAARAPLRVLGGTAMMTGAAMVVAQAAPEASAGGSGPAPIATSASDAAAQQRAYLDSIRSAGDAQTQIPFNRLPRASEFAIIAGSAIPFVLDHPVDSEISNCLIVGHVSRDVRDSLTHRFVEIPDKSRIIGHCSGGSSQAGGIVKVTLERLIFPDLTSILLPGQVGSDADGRTGFSAQLNDHRGRALGIAAITAVLSTIPIVASGTGSIAIGTTPTVLQSLGGNVANNIAQTGANLAQAQLNQGTHLTIAAGVERALVLDRDIPFPAPYAPVPAGTRQ
jgi:type IV secretory pathway VirB10-like protein